MLDVLLYYWVWVLGVFIYCKPKPVLIV